MPIDNKGGFGQIVDAIRDKATAKETNRLLDSINRQMKDDAFDVTKAVHKIERKISNRIADLEAQQEAAYIRGQTDTRDVQNPFESNEVTKLYVDSLKDVVSDVHRMTRDELKANITRMQALTEQIINDDELQERDFLLEQYGKSLKFMQREHEKRSNLLTRGMNKMGELTEQYLDIQSLAAGFFDNNPIAMGLFKVGADAVRSYRGRKQMERKMVAEDLRRQNYAKVIEEDRKKDQDLAAKRQEEIDKANMEAAQSFDSEEMQEAFQEGLQEGIQAGIAEAFAGGFAFPEDEYSDTGDAPLSADDLADIFGVTGGASASFVRDHDAEMEEQRQEAMASMRRSAEVLEEAIDPSSRVDDLESKTMENFERIRGRDDEREDDERHAERVQWQEEVLEKFDTMIGHLEKMDKSFTKIGKAGGFGGGGDGGMFDEVVGGVAGAAGAGILGKMAGKFKKPASALLKFAKPAVTGAAGLAGMVGMSKMGDKLTGSFTKLQEKVAPAATEAAAKATGGVAKSATKSAGKGIGKSLLKKIPVIGLLAGGAFAISRLLEGDYAGAGAELASGAASLVPGAGTAVSAGIDAALLARDITKDDVKKEQEQAMAGVDKRISNVNKEAREGPAWYDFWSDEAKPVAYTDTGAPIYEGENYTGDILTDAAGKPWTEESGGKPAGRGTMGGPTVDQAKDNAGVLTGSGFDRLRNEIAEGEGTSDAKARKHGFESGYDVPYGYGQYAMPDKPLSQMTVAEVKAFQKKQIAATKGTIPGTRMGTGAVGKYQVTQGTLAEQQKKLGFSDDALFDSTLQEQIGDSLLMKRGLAKFQRGEMSEAQFQRELSREWASVADPRSGRSAYGQATGTSSDEIREAMRAAKLESPDETPGKIQTAALERSIVGYNDAKAMANKPQAPVQLPPQKSHSLAQQSASTGRSTGGGQKSARNGDSTLQRVTDRFITHGLA